MRIEKLSQSNIADVYNCLGDRRQNLAPELSESARYLDEYLERGWLAYAVYNDSDEPVGMAILTPSTDPLSPVRGEGIYHLQCMNVLKEWTKEGVGRGLVRRMIQDVQALGGRGISVECYGEYWMPKSFFAHIGFQEVERLSDHSIFLRRISPDANATSVGLTYKGELPSKGIQVDIQHWVTCPFIINNYRQVAAIVRRIVPHAVVRERSISTQEDVERWGGSGVFVNGESVSAGPIREEDIRKAIQRGRRD